MPPPPILFPWESRSQGSSLSPGQCFSKCWSELESFAAPPRGNLRAGFSCTDFSSSVALGTRYVQLLSGCRHIGRLCWSCFTIVEMSCSRGSESDQVFLGEGISFVDRESLGWAKLGHPCRVMNFQKPCSRLWADGNLLISGCRELDT